MRVIRVYDSAEAAGEQYAEEVTNVASAYVTGAGALAVELEHGDRPGTLRGVIIAHGAWQRVEDWNATDPEPDQQRADAEQLDPDQLAEKYGPPLAAALEIEQRARQIDMPTLPALPPLVRPAGLLPGHVQLPGESVGIVRDPLAMSNALRLRHALTVYCLCARLRCPEIVAHRGTFYEPEPVQCQMLDMHDGPHLAPEPSLWVWGPHNHHPSCPRHPDTYNAHPGLCGRPLEIEGVPLVGTGCLLPWDHTGAHDYAHPDLDGRAAPRAGLTVIPAQRERVSAAAALRSVGLVGTADTLAGNAGRHWPAAAPYCPCGAGPEAGECAPAPVLSGDVVPLVEPGPLVDPALRDWFSDRTIGQTCGALSMDKEPCDRPAGHDSGPHAHFTPEGGLAQW